jgi:predicted nucleotidyltransferase
LSATLRFIGFVSNVESEPVRAYIVDMIDLVKQKKNELATLCRTFRVARLDLFGSAATGKFNPESSDLDFMIEFENRSEPGLLNRYLDFAEALEQLFNRHVDLVTQHSIRNPYFQENIASTKQSLYEHRT